MINTDKEKLLAEIERLKHYGPIPYDRDVFEGVCLIESFINSLPVEHQNEDLDIEINLEYKSNNALMMPIEDFRELILYFTDWQKERIIKKAYDWLNDNFYQYGEDGTDNNGSSILYDFKKAMEE